jgi:hypothetical protein
LPLHEVAGQYTTAPHGQLPFQYTNFGSVIALFSDCTALAPESHHGVFPAAR